LKNLLPLLNKIIKLALIERHSLLFLTILFYLCHPHEAGCLLIHILHRCFFLFFILNLCLLSKCVALTDYLFELLLLPVQRFFRHEEGLMRQQLRIGACSYSSSIWHKNPIFYYFPEFYWPHDFCFTLQYYYISTY